MGQSKYTYLKNPLTTFTGKVMMKFLATALLGLTAYEALAQVAIPSVSSYTAAPYAMVEMAEIRIGHTVCVSYKHTGWPIYFVLRTTRMDLFWNSLPKIEECLLKLQKITDDPKKHLGEMMIIPEGLSPFIDKSGQHGDIRCREYNGVHIGATMNEFSFPYLKGSKDVKAYFNETNLRICFDEMIPTKVLVPPHWTENS